MSVITDFTRQKIRTHGLPALSAAVVLALWVFQAELDALIYQWILQFRYLPSASAELTYLMSVPAAFLLLLGVNRFRHAHMRHLFVAYLAYLLLLLAAAALLLGVWLPPLKVLLVMVLAHLLWLALSAKSAQDSIDYVLQNMHTELTHLGMEAEEDAQQLSVISQQSRIARLMLTMQHLRDLHKSRNDALMFISHDIRTPLGAAILLLEKFEPSKYTQRMQQLLERAHLMAEGFVHASRAESADVNKFNVIDMVSLTQQVVDDLYELMQAKRLHEKIHVPEAHVLVRGDYGLLYRAVSNVLSNAVNYSPENATVEIDLTADTNSMELRVLDQGPGIPENKIPKLFKRFSRAEEEYPTNNGCGLGLYFVNVTVRKHRGNVAVRNLSHRGAEFLIKLPLERRKVNLTVPYERRADTRSVSGDTA